MSHFTNVSFAGTFSVSGTATFSGGGGTSSGTWSGTLTATISHLSTGAVTGSWTASGATSDDPTVITESGFIGGTPSQVTFILVSDHLFPQFSGAAPLIGQSIQFSGPYNLSQAFEGGTATFVGTINWLLTSSALEASLPTAGDDVLGGTGGADTVRGGAGNDQVSGGAGDDALFGDAGDDIVDGGDGNDRLSGGAGADILIAGSGNNLLDGGAGIDTAKLLGNRSDYLLAVIDGPNDAKLFFTLSGLEPGDVVNMVSKDGRVERLAGVEKVVFLGDNSEFQVTRADLLADAKVFVAARYFADFAGTGNLTGTALADVLEGLEGDDQITGLGGHDRLDGGTGNDTMTGGAGNDVYVVDAAGDAVNESAGQGTDRISVTGALAAYTLTENVERLEFTGAGAFAGTGNTRANTLVGGVGNDTLDGGAGADRMEGGAGNDTYSVDLLANSVTLAPGDTVVELIGGGTADTVRSSVSYTLGVNVENLVLLGALNRNGTGNAGDNALTGNDGNNVLSGAAGDDTFFTSAGNDRFVGGAGADTLNLSSLMFSQKELPGGFTVARPNATTVVITSGSQAFTATGAWGSASAEKGIESFVFSDQMVTLAQLIDNTKSAFADALTGTAGNDTLEGLAGSDTLDGGAGADSLAGGLGNDTYLVDNAGDLVLELAGQGADLVRTALAAYTLPENVERLEFTGAGAFAGTGNTRANTLVGGAGADTLDGGLGADRMEGGAGNDTYVVERVASADGLVPGDVVFEGATLAADTGGSDTVRSTVSYRLGLNVENLVLLNGASLNTGGTGNALDNALTGNDGRNALSGAAGSDTLAGGLGSDRLTGGADADVFVFDTALDPALNVDTITDFAAGSDRIRLAAGVFAQAGPAGALAQGAFAAGTSAQEADDRILYDQATGGLRYDADGAGGVDAVLFAMIGTTTHPFLTAGDFEIA